MKTKIFLLGILATVSFSLNAQTWNVTGNTGLVSGNYLGTTASQGGFKDLDFRTGGSTRMYIQHSTGFIGLGTIAPGAKFHVFTSTINQFGFISGDNSRQLFSVPYLAAGGYSSLSQAGDVGLFFRNGTLNSGNAGFVLAPHNSLGVGIRISYDGKVMVKADHTNPVGASFEVNSTGGAFTFGILSKVTNAQCKALSVMQGATENFLVYGNGTVFARELWVKVGVLGDFVFEPDYKLMPLSEVETFVKTNKHLPKIPTEAEVQKNSMNVGEMQALQLQKIEELTLYIIELQKQIDALKVQMTSVENQGK